MLLGNEGTILVLESCLGVRSLLLLGSCSGSFEVVLVFRSDAGVWLVGWRAVLVLGSTLYQDCSEIKGRLCLYWEAKPELERLCCNK